MRKALKKLFGFKTRPSETKRDFSSFFNNATDEEKLRLLKEVARKANDDQRALIERYEQARQKTA